MQCGCHSSEEAWAHRSDLMSKTVGDQLGAGAATVSSATNMMSHLPPRKQDCFLGRGIRNIARSCPARGMKADLPERVQRDRSSRIRLPAASKTASSRRSWEEVRGAH